MSVRVSGSARSPTRGGCCCKDWPSLGGGRGHGRVRQQRRVFALPHAASPAPTWPIFPGLAGSNRPGRRIAPPNRTIPESSNSSGGASLRRRWIIPARPPSEEGSHQAPGPGRSKHRMRWCCRLPRRRQPLSAVANLTGSTRSPRIASGGSPRLWVPPPISQREARKRVRQVRERIKYGRDQYASR